MPLRSLSCDAVGGQLFHDVPNYLAKHGSSYVLISSCRIANSKQQFEMGNAECGIFDYLYENMYRRLRTQIVPFFMKLNLLRSVRSLISLVCKMINRCCRPLIYPKNTFEEKIICSLFSNLIIDLSTLFLIFNYREWRRVDNSKKYGSALEIGWFEKFFILQYRYHIHMHFSTFARTRFDFFASKFQFLVTYLLRIFIRSISPCCSKVQ